MATKKDHLFCPVSGYLLELDAKRGAAVCTVSGFRRDLSELTNVSIVSHTDMEDYRRRFNLEPLVRSTEDEELAKGRKRATVDEPCPKCKHPQMEFYTMQLRSADEGQTVFYECPNCGHKYSQNT
uniref:DNA-directed RNA polymerase subunit n=1 Tax=Chlamydomonas leiostraca TaxID=1034604 RepID=A0A7S0WT88_9CHLO|mmetsp:Transcript_27624/g.70379  ORF Transcript_27624/g.70379 Transcript_27624/m.70379 type:complete len:125 (+) Transcript_27624:93-467(+)|eukprot:CAMPEP_0202857980 /NCGR_PEP_ID=MMETSP1391-20130828/702_1 /ASSEMBLY_ACC=CAM_ASM_000867 /TAXON_ID=1034604 /ORGANISM="Chlamydomonas leiostraca, Strain SAG 11-49" /LENGTH=124 /DNA_ID=CAMNT_0049536845 /DNA_START=88 /DNA_END=462 /DNA_ORIENTATION=-